MSNQDLDALYKLGALKALSDAGLVKQAFLSQALGWAAKNPMLAKTLGGAALGGVAGGVSDVGAGRGMLAGAAAGAGAHYGAGLGQRVLGRAVGAERAGIRAAARAGSSPATTEASKLMDFAGKWGFGTPQWQQNMRMARGAGGAALGGLGAAGTLAASGGSSSPSDGKSWIRKNWEAMSGPEGAAAMML